MNLSEDLKQMRQEEKAKLKKPNILKFKALGDGLTVEHVIGKRILVIPVEAYTDMDRVEKAGTIIIPDTVREKNQPPPSTGIVVQMGSQCVCEENRASNGSLLVNEGSMIMFSKYAGSDFNIDGRTYKVLDLQEVMCTLVDTKGVVGAITDGDSQGQN